MGTIPQWICAIALVLILVVLGTNWSGFPAEWVTAVATAMLAFAALVGLGGVLVPLQIERIRRRANHLSRLLAVVLLPIHEELEGRYESRVERRHTPLAWRRDLGFHEYIAPIIRNEYLGDDTPPDEPDLYATLYADTRKNHYPILIADYEQFRSGYNDLVEMTRREAVELEATLHGKCSLTDSSVENPNGLGIHFPNLTLYIFCRLWLANYSYPLSVRTIGLYQAQLCCEGTSEFFANGTEQELRIVLGTVEELIATQKSLESIQVADNLVPKLNVLKGAIADIRVNDSLEGDCAATKSKSLFA